MPELERPTWRMNVKIAGITDVDEQRQTYKALFRIEAYYDDKDVNIQEIQKLMKDRGDKGDEIEELRFYWNHESRNYSLSSFDVEELLRAKGDDDKSFDFKTHAKASEKTQDTKDQSGFYTQGGLSWPSLTQPVDREPIVPMGSLYTEIIVEPYLTLYKDNDPKGNQYWPHEEHDLSQSYEKNPNPEPVQFAEGDQIEKLRPLGNVKWNCQMSCVFMIGKDQETLNLQNFPHDAQYLRFHFGMRRSTWKNTVLQLHAIWALNKEKSGEVWERKSMWCSFSDVHSTQLHFHVPCEQSHPYNTDKQKNMLTEVEFFVPYSRKIWFFRYLYALSFTFTCLTYYAYCIPVVTVADRGSVLFLILLTVLTFTFSTAGEIPKLAYPTLIDIYFYSSIFFLVVACVETGVVGQCVSLYCESANQQDVNHDQKDWADDTGTEWDIQTCPMNYISFDRWFAIIGGCIWLLFNVIFYVIVRIVANRRDEMAGTTLEKHYKEQLDHDLQKNGEGRSEPVNKKTAGAPYAGLRGAKHSEYMKRRHSSSKKGSQKSSKRSSDSNLTEPLEGNTTL